MTEITDSSPTPLSPAVQQFVLHWGNLGDRWGVNRSVWIMRSCMWRTNR
jgi:DNA-binding transcriptional regulator GbsR (MarR family)